MIEGITVLILVLLLAWANGANDLPKGIATLVGNGVSRASRAIAWGTLWTVTDGLTLRWAGHLQPHEADALKWILLGWVVTFPVTTVISASVMQVLKTL